MGRTKEPRDGNDSRSGDAFAARYPHIAAWVLGGWVEIGHDDMSRSFIHALDIGGLVWEGKASQSTLDEGPHALDVAIAAWLQEHGGSLPLCRSQAGAGTRAPSPAAHRPSS